MIYTITMNEKQAKAIMAACEEYFRVRMGQFGELAEDLSLLPNKGTMPNGTQFDRWLVRRDDANAVFATAYNIATCRNQYLSCDVRTDDSRIAEDYYQVIRHQLWLDRPESDRPTWTVDSQRCMPMSDEPVPVMEKAE